MKYIYLASVNPMHYSHFNTWKMAEDILGDKVFLGIVQSLAKNRGLFSLSERAAIARKYFGIPNEQIVILPRADDVIKIVAQAEKVIRGIRNESDRLEALKLAKIYGLCNQEKKLLEISVPEPFRLISSTQLIDKISRGDYYQEMNWIPEELIPVIRERIFKH